jgi:Icc protein
MSAQFGQYPPARQTIVHLSDPHFLGGNAPLYGVVDTEQHLAQTLEQIRAMQIRPSALVFTGDLADLGEPDAYARLRALVEPVAADLGAQLIWLMGNHDERAEFRAGLFGADESDAPVDVVYDLDGLRFVGLDSSVPGWHHGALADEQLEWLADVLSEPAEHGTIVGLHHPPVPSPLSFFDILELQEQHRLESILQGSDVRAILGGHLHYSTNSLFAGIPVSVAAATCYTMNLTRPLDHPGGVDGGQSFSLVHVYDDRITFSTVPVGEYPPSNTFPADFVERMSRLTPAERLEAFSRKR